MSLGRGRKPERADVTHNITERKSKPCWQHRSSGLNLGRSSNMAVALMVVSWPCQPVSPDRTQCSDVSHHWGMGEVEGIEGQAAEYVEEENKISTHKKQQGVWIEINDDHIK